MELALDRHEDGPKFSRVNTRLEDNDGRPTRIAADNPILDTRMVEVEYSDGYKTTMKANSISSNLFSQVNQDGQRFVLFVAIIDSCTNGTHIKEGHSFIHMSNGNKRSRETTKRWEVCIQCKDRISSWNQVKDIKESLPVHLAEYAVLNQIADGP